jgi:Rod binding domain-containing protein
VIGDALGRAFGYGTVAVDARRKFAELHKATDGMQTAFVKTMVAELQKATQKQFENLPGGDVYSDMQNQVISEKLTQTGHLGLSDTLYQSMAKKAFQQELGTAYGNYFRQKQTTGQPAVAEGTKTST